MTSTSSIWLLRMEYEKFQRGRLLHAAHTYPGPPLLRHSRGTHAGCAVWPSHTLLEVASHVVCSRPPVKTTSHSSLQAVRLIGLSQC